MKIKEVNLDFHRYRLAVVVARHRLLDTARAALERRPIVVLTGPRQCGKTTLARQILDPAASTYFDLEDPRTRALFEEPMTALEPLTGLVVIDEVQKDPGPFPLLRVLADRSPRPGRSSSRECLGRDCCGRAPRVSLAGWSTCAWGASRSTRPVRRRLRSSGVRGGFPDALLAPGEETPFAGGATSSTPSSSAICRSGACGVSTTAMRRFWTMVAHYHGQVWNNADPARALGVSEPTVRSYLDC